MHHINLLDSWLFVKKDGEWFFNPFCDGLVPEHMQSLQEARLITVERKRPIDVPALAIHIRHAIGNRDWGRFLERYALPKPAVVMADNATNEDRSKYIESASQMENGQVTVWPSGSSLMDFAGGSRGIDPFSSFISHQEKTIVMLATGGTLGSIAEAGAGTLAGNAQADVWESIVQRDAVVIETAINRGLVKPFIEGAFPGQKCLVEFRFDLTPIQTPKEIFELAAAARSAGYRIEQAQLEEATGFRLEKESEMGLPSGGMGIGRATNSIPPFKTNDFPFKISLNKKR